MSIAGLLIALLLDIVTPSGDTLNEQFTRIAVSPNPCTIAPLQMMCAVEISWTAQGVNDASLWVVDSNDPVVRLFAEGPSGRQSFPWIRSGVIYTFLLYGGPDDSYPLIAHTEVRSAPSFRIYDVPPLDFPAGKGTYGRGTDSNSPAHWDGDKLYLFTSAGHPFGSLGPNLFELSNPAEPVTFDASSNGARWMEATHKGSDGMLYGWYHNEPHRVCPDREGRSAPRIGAARSADNGVHWQDLGIVIEAPPNQLRCDTENRFFAGGNGGFAVVLDETSGYFYFLISTYHSDPQEQGISIARMLFADRDSPVGKVWKWFNGSWDQPGLEGHVTPILPAAIDWHRNAADAFWGPSVHWNTYLDHYVILLNHARNADWIQEGIYVAYNRDISNPQGWSQPVKILDSPGNGEGQSYPQVMGLGLGETDKCAGRTARLFLFGRSNWEIVFERNPRDPSRSSVSPSVVERPTSSEETSIVFQFEITDALPDVSWGIHLVSWPGVSRGDYVIPDSTNHSYWFNGAFTHEYFIPSITTLGVYTYEMKDLKGNVLTATLTVQMGRGVRDDRR